jgi:hypothetical protein
VWGSTSPEEESVLSEVDRGIARLVAHVDRQVGKGRYVVAFTADHGQEMLPESTGGWRINGAELKRDLVAKFGPVVTRVAAGEIYLDHAAMARAGLTASEVSAFVAGYTIRDATPGRRMSSSRPRGSTRRCSPVCSPAATSRASLRRRSRASASRRTRRASSP